MTEHHCGEKIVPCSKGLFMGIRARDTRLVFRVHRGRLLVVPTGRRLGMMRHGSIDWLALFISLISVIFLVSGATWCVSPKSFVKAHRGLFPKNPVSTARWESGVCSISGRVCGAMFRLLCNLHPLSVVDRRVSLDHRLVLAGMPPRED
jgi:hypothetical protein